MRTNYHGCVDNAIRAVRHEGSHFFDADTMRYFGSKTYELYETPFESDDDPRRNAPSYLVMSNRDKGFYGSHGFTAAYDGKRYYYVIALVPGADIGYSATIERDVPGMPDPGFWTLNAARNLARKLRDSHKVVA